MPTKTVEVGEAETRLKELVSWVATGTEVILTDGDMCVARLLPIEVSANPRLPGLHAGAIWTSDDFDGPLPDDFWASEP